MSRFLYFIIFMLAGAVAAEAQCTNMVLNPLTGKFDCTGAIGPQGVQGVPGPVSSVGATVPSWLTVTGSPVTGAGTLAIIPATGQTPHQVIGTCNAATTFGPCNLVVGDLPSSALLTAYLSLFTNTLQGLVPSSGGGTTNFLRADGTWAAPPGGGGMSVGGAVTSGTATNFLYVGAGPVLAQYTPAQATLALTLFGTAAQGLVPASGGGTTNYLRADGTWAVPPVNGGGGLSAVVVAGGSGVSVAGNCNPLTSSGTCTVSSNFAVAASLDTLHQAILVCTSSNGTYAYTCATPNKTIASLTAGQMVLLKADVTNSGAPTLAIDSINGGTPYSITTSSGSTAPSNGTILAGMQGINLLTFNGTVFTLPPSAIAGLTTATDVSGVEYVAGSGTAQAQTATLTPAISGYTNGLEVCWKPAAANTAAAPTLAVNGLTATAVTKLGSTALIANDIVTTAIACARYNSSGPRFELQNPQTNSGAGGSPAYTAVTFSATPTFTISGTNPNTFYMSLSGNVTSFTVSGGTAGQHMTLIWNQDATGAHTVACPMNVLGCFAVGLTSNKNNAQDYVYSSDASAWIADSVGVINQ